MSAQSAGAGNGSASGAHIATNVNGTSGAEVAQRLSQGPELSASMQAWNGGENAQAAAAHAARLMVNADLAEMNIALQGEALGPVQVRAHVSGDQVGAAITVERHDVHAVLSSELPALHQGLTERDLRPTTVSVFHGALQTGAGMSDGGNRQQEGTGTAQRNFSSGPGTIQFADNAENPVAATESQNRTIFDSSGRLSVRA